jgi:hypothetical protein
VLREVVTASPSTGKSLKKKKLKKIITLLI